MALKLTVKQIADAQVSLDLVSPVFHTGIRTGQPWKEGEERKLREAFGKLRQLVKDLNEVEVSVKG